jgi:hypothetical protein
MTSALHYSSFSSPIFAVRPGARLETRSNRSTAELQLCCDLPAPEVRGPNLVNPGGVHDEPRPANIDAVSLPMPRMSGSPVRITPDSFAC